MHVCGIFLISIAILSLFDHRSNAFSSSRGRLCSRIQQGKMSQRVFGRTMMGATLERDPTLTLLQRRLHEAGVPGDQMAMLDDEDWSRLETRSSGSRNDEKKDTSKTEDASNDTTIEIKTLVWEVTCHHHDHATGRSYKEEGDHTPLDKLYVVTALRMEDKVELSLLRDLVYKQHNLPFGCALARLSIAPQDIAESLTGFTSGCMPPIGHSTPMKIFIDSSIANATNVATASIGAGVLGKSLLLPLSEFLRVAKESGKGAGFGSFVLSRRSSSSSTSVERSMSPVKIRKQQKVDRLHRLAEPKDRLAEYRKLKNLIDKAKLLRTTARKQGRVEDMEKLVKEAVSQYDFPELFHVSTETGMDKNSLHLCAWRGDFECVKLLVRTAKSLYPDLDLINTISKGDGNYGKTPIFFALTQCREEVVRFLIAEGANLLIVNNKGQTPCSIAVSHLKEEACKYLFETEAKQLKDGGTFVDYRETHSDGKLYGDLDPRFDLDDANLGTDDVSGQLRKFQESLRNAPEGSVYNGLPTVFEPRSVRPTVRWWVREARSLEAANREGTLNGQITFTQPRPPSPKKKRDSTISRRPPSPQRKDVTVRESISRLPRLVIDDVLEESTSSTQFLVIVKDSKTMSLLEQEIDKCKNDAADLTRHQDGSFDEMIVNSTWGIDCEWQPGEGRGVSNPVSTLQLSNRRKAFLIDLQSICEDFRRRPQSLAGVEGRLDSVLSKLFSDPDLPILGYGVMQDLGKLAASFPHLKCFSAYSSVIDLQTVSSLVHPKSSRQSVSSLQKITAHLLDKRLDKAQQCSDWALRPLAQEQIDYALLDAAVLPQLLTTMMKRITVLDRYNGQFFKIHATLRSSVRYTKVETPDKNHAYSVPMGTIKTALGQQIARQSWPTTQVEPPLPELVPAKVDEKSLISEKERAHLLKVNATTRMKRPKPVELRTLAGNLENLPFPGITLGYTKESCVFRVVGHELLNTFPDGTYVGFNRRAGVLETTNAWIVFCNFGSRPYQGWTMEGRSFSEFYNGGRQVSFRLNPKAQSGKSSEASLFRHLTMQSDESHGHNNVLLFARYGTKSKYLYCGLCECVKAVPLESGATCVLFELLEFDKLVGAAKISSDFEDLVASRREILEQAH